MEDIYTLVIIPIFVNFLAFYDINHHLFKVKKIGSAPTTVSQIAIAICCVGNVSI